MRKEGEREEKNMLIFPLFGLQKKRNENKNMICILLLYPTK